MDKTELDKILAAHVKCLSSAPLSGAYLAGAYLDDADLSYADLSSADLCSTCLRYACLRGANLSGANLRCADLCNAELQPPMLSRWSAAGSVNITTGCKSLFMERVFITVSSLI